MFLKAHSNTEIQYINSKNVWRNPDAQCSLSTNTENLQDWLNLDSPKMRNNFDW